MKKGRANSDVPFFLYDGRNKTSITTNNYKHMKNRYLKSLTARVTILMLSFLCLARKQGARGTNPDGEKEQLFNQCCVVTKAGNAPYD